MADRSGSFGMYEVLGLVVEERERQRAKSGDDGHADVGAAYFAVAEPLDYTVSLRSIVEAGKRNPGGAGWLEILLEEVGESRDAVGMLGRVQEADERAAWRAKLRAELVQVAATAVAWLEDLERREAAAKGGDHG